MLEDERGQYVHVYIHPINGISTLICLRLSRIWLVLRIQSMEWYMTAFRQHKWPQKHMKPNKSEQKTKSSLRDVLCSVSHGAVLSSIEVAVHLYACSAPTHLHTEAWGERQTATTTTKTPNWVIQKRNENRHTASVTHKKKPRNRAAAAGSTKRRRTESMY